MFHPPVSADNPPRPLITRVPKGRGIRTEIRLFGEDELESFYAGAAARDQRLADAPC